MSLLGAFEGFFSRFFSRQLAVLQKRQHAYASRQRHCGRRGETRVCVPLQLPVAARERWPRRKAFGRGTGPGAVRVRWLGAQMGRGWPGIRLGTRLCQSSQSSHKQRPTVPESQELCSCGVPLWVVPDSQECCSACAGSGKNSVTGLIACHFTTRMRRRGRPRVCTNLFLFFRYVDPARAATAGPARPGSADAARGPDFLFEHSGRGAVGGSLC